MGSRYIQTSVKLLLCFQTYSFIIQSIKWTSLDMFWKKLLPSSLGQMSMPYCLYWIRSLKVSPERWEMYESTQCHIADDSTLCGHEPGRTSYLIDKKTALCMCIPVELFWWCPGSYLWITRYVDIQVLFFFVNIRHFNLCGL
jgi:hypothetical protein